MKPLLQIAVVGFTFLLVLPIARIQAEKKEMTVKIIDRQNNETRATYTIPGYSTSNSTANLNCYGTTTLNCSSTTTTTGMKVPARTSSFTVQGATFALQLPDGRVAVVNCESKFKERFAGRAGNRRSCRMPVTDVIQVEFSGDNAKLKWPISLDGKKIESETYKILGVLDNKQ